MGYRNNAGMNSQEKNSSYNKVFDAVVKTPEFKSLIEAAASYKVERTGTKFFVPYGESRPKAMFVFKLIRPNGSVMTEFSVSASDRVSHRNVFPSELLQSVSVHVIGVKRHERDRKPIVSTYNCKLVELNNQFPTWICSHLVELGLEAVRDRVDREVQAMRDEYMNSEEFISAKDEAMRDHVRKTISDCLMQFQDQPDELIEESLRTFQIRSVMDT